MNYKTIFRDVMRDYQQARDSAEDALAARKAEAYRLLPELQEIDRSLAKLGLSLARLAIAGDTTTMGEVRQQTDTLKERREQLITTTFGADYLTLQYRCKSCQDTGYEPSTGGKPNRRCACLTQRLVNEFYSLSNIKTALAEENFDTYDFRLFSTELIPTEGLSPHANMQSVYRHAMNFATNFDTEFANLLLYGEPGLGKTFVCHCIAKDLLDSGKTVLYLTAPRLCKVLENYRFNRENMADPEELLTQIDEVDLLILDDLGAEFPTVVTSSALFDIINQRLLTRKHTVISTNLHPAALEQQYSERIVSRFWGNYKLIKFFGEDIREKKKYGGLRM